MELVDTQKLKKNFGLLLSKLYTDCNFSVQEITELLVRKDYFDFLELQKPELFLDCSIEKTIKSEFYLEVIFNKETLSEFYWSGIMYMSICLNKKIPLRQIPLLCPLSTMLSYYKIYHEMNDVQLINQFMENDYKTSILRVLRKKKNLTIKKLSLLTNIPEYTLKYYEKNNDSLFSASFENINKIAMVLNVSNTFFSRNSKFIPFTYFLFEDVSVFTTLSQKINLFYDNKPCTFEFDGLTLLRISEKKKEYVPELYIQSALDQTMREYSKTNILLF